MRTLEIASVVVGCFANFVAVTIASAALGCGLVAIPIAGATSCMLGYLLLTD